MDYYQAPNGCSRCGSRRAKEAFDGTKFCAACGREGR